MVKYLHVIGTGHKEVVKGFPKFINEHFDPSEHGFLIVGKKFDGCPEGDNVAWMEEYDDKKLINTMKDCERVFLHAFFVTFKTKLMLIKNKSITKKLVWVEWGKDLYENVGKSGIKGKLVNFVDRKAKGSAAYFVGILPQDIDYYNKKYGKAKKTFFAKYSFGTNKLYDKPPVVRSMKSKREAGESINIMIGHQSTPVLEHKTVIDWLTKYKDENIKVYLPLSYGDMEYAASVNDYASEKLGDKAVPVMEYVPFEKYTEMLGNMDIAIFHTKRQIGLGNVSQMIYMQKKVYFEKGGVLYDYYTSFGVKIQDSNEIKDQSFEEFVSDVDMSEATEIIRTNASLETNIKRWRTVFEGIL